MAWFSARTRTVTLSWPNIGTLPRNVNLVLRDIETGERRFLRTTGTLRLTVPSEGLTRRCALTLAPLSQLLRITGVQGQSTRAGGAAQFTIRYTLIESARMQITVMSTDKVVRTLENGRTRSAGSQAIQWDGRDSTGRARPPGTYLIQIQAESPEGPIARVSTPVVLTR